jgi:hypothetical protein
MQSPHDDTTEYCHWLHEQLEKLPAVQYPFDSTTLPNNGIYFFYENGEFWGHGHTNRRIVRIGTHKDGNFKSRMSEHFLLKESKMNFTSDRPGPHDRSIFRKNLGRALLEGDDYLKIWDIDFTKTANRKKYSSLRNIAKEKELETEITKLIRECFSFRFIMFEGQRARMGSGGVESRLISTVANCKLCKPSDSWLGLHSSKPQIKGGKLWLVQHLKGPPLSARDNDAIAAAIETTQDFLKACKSF